MHKPTKPYYSYTVYNIILYYSLHTFTLETSVVRGACAQEASSSASTIAVAAADIFCLAICTDEAQTFD